MKHIYHNPVFDRITKAKREKILYTAIEEFADKGFNGANINTIAEKAGISIGSLYKYFSTKEHLYLTVVNLGTQYLENALNPILDSHKNLVQKIEAIVDVIFEVPQKYTAITRLYNRFTSESDSQLSKQLAVSLESISANAYRKMLHTAKMEGVIGQEVDESVFAFCMDNIFLILQFSLSSDYYHNRLKIYLGEEVLNDLEKLKKQIILFLKRALLISV